MSIALALGQIEEAIGLIEEGNRSGALLALGLAREYLRACRRSAIWTDIVSFIAGFVIIVVFAWMVIDALPGPGP